MKKKRKCDLVPDWNKVKMKGGGFKCQNGLIKESKLLKIPIAEIAYHQRI